MATRKLTPTIHDKVWGSPHTEPWLANPEHRNIGEIWFAAPEIPSLLVKLLFTSERLSVQVHPDDTYAQAHGELRGKTEMWHVLRADPNAAVAHGLRETISMDDLRAAALSGEILHLLDWTPAHVGDTFFVPAGTIHAIGGGLVLCEIQQYSDATYRLFDYHRQPARPLHLDDSIAVARLTRDDSPAATKPSSTSDVLAECQYFRTERLSVQSHTVCENSAHHAIWIVTEGTGYIGGEAFGPGDAWLVSPFEPVSVDSTNAIFLLATVPGACQ